MSLSTTPTVDTGQDPQPDDNESTHLLRNQSETPSHGSINDAPTKYVLNKSSSSQEDENQMKPVGDDADEDDADGFLQPTSTLSEPEFYTARSPPPDQQPLIYNPDSEHENPNYNQPRIHNDDESDYEINDDDDNMSKIVKFAKRPSFIWICTLGILAFIIMQLTFLPRTSLARDYRRWHGIHLTKSDVKRRFLQMAGIGNSHNSLTTEEYIDNWLSNFTNINSKHATNMISDDNLELLGYVENQFKGFGFKTELFNYDVPNGVHLNEPKGSSLRLIDKNNGQVIYSPLCVEPGFETPAFYAMGRNGSVIGEYIFVNEGTPKDYSLLSKHGVEVQGKIVIVCSKNYDSKNITIAEKVSIAEYNGAIGFINYFDFPKSSKNNIENEPRLNVAISRDFIFENCKIPAIPISKKIIKPILETLSTETSSKFANWEYSPYVSNSPIQLELNTTFSSQKRKLTNIVASIKGIMNDADVIIGARRDSYTSSNPLSGHAILLEIMRNYQRLVKLGWKPLRNIIFISWDGSISNNIGAKLFMEDKEVFNPKRSVVAYINIDGDAVMGSKFTVDAHPMLLELLRYTAKFIPIPTEATCVKTLSNVFEKDDQHAKDDDDDDDDDGDDGYTTLHKYWMKQDNATINHILGLPIVNTESMIFQQHLSVPTINLKFSNDPKRDKSLYIPNSNYYSRDWLVKREIDDELLLHGLMIRFIGLLAISLSEHEVVDYKTHSYFKHIGKFFQQFKDGNENTIIGWKDQFIPNYLIGKSNILSDMNMDKISFGSLINEVTTLISKTIDQSQIFDDWNYHVEEGLTQDYPWYMYYKKLQHFAQFKVSNYKLSHLDRDLKLNSHDYNTYLNKDRPTEIAPRQMLLSLSMKEQHKKKQPYYYDSIIYGTPDFTPDVGEDFFRLKLNASTFTNLHKVVGEEDFEMSVKWLILIYEKFRSLNYKMT